MADEQIYCIPRESVTAAWPGVAQMIAAAYKFADEDVPPDLIDNLRSGHRQLWVAWDGSKVLAAAITRINVQRSGLACQIAACGGTEGERWMHLISRIEDWARAEGCRKVVIEGRPGWERVFPAYKRVRVVLEREL